MQEVDEKQVALEFLIGDLANIKDYLVECRKRLDAIKKGSWKKYSSKELRERFTEAAKLLRNLSKLEKEATTLLRCALKEYKDALPAPHQLCYFCRYAHFDKNMEFFFCESDEGEYDLCDLFLAKDCGHFKEK